MSGGADPTGGVAPEAIDAEIARFCECLSGRATPDTIGRCVPGARDLLLFVYREGLVLGAESFLRFERELCGRGPGGSGELSHVQVTRLLSGARRLLREHAREDGKSGLARLALRRTRVHWGAQLGAELAGRVAADAARFAARLDKSKPGRGGRALAGVRELLAFMAQEGDAEVSENGLARFRAALFARGPDGTGELTRGRVVTVWSGAREYVRMRVSWGELAGLDFAEVFPDRALCHTAGKALAGFERDQEQRGYSSTHTAAAVRELLIFLAREGVSLERATDADVERFRRAVLSSRTRVAAEHVLGRARAFIAWARQRGLCAPELVLRAQVHHGRAARPGPTLTAFIQLLGWIDEGVRACALAPHTRKAYLWAWRDFLVWAEQHGLCDLASLSRDVMTGYRVHLQAAVGVRGTPLAASTQAGIFAALRFGCSWLSRTGRLLSDPTLHLGRPRPAQRVVATLRPRDVARLIGSLGDTPVELRDRAMLELLYGTGLRRTELLRLTVDDVDFEAKTVLVREGKGRRDRLLPLPGHAREALIGYLASARDALRHGRQTQALFLSLQGRPLGVSWAGEHLRQLAARHGLRLTPHVLRHTCATELLRGRADIRQIQRLLGHASLASTERYTRVDVSDLRDVVRRCHPRERERQ